MLYINNDTYSKLKAVFPDLKDVDMHLENRPGSWQTNRYIQIFINGQEHDIHYEYLIDRDWNGRLELHFEGADWGDRYNDLIDHLMNSTQNSDLLTWSGWDLGYRCQHVRKISDISDLCETLQYMRGIFDKLIEKFHAEAPAPEDMTIECDNELDDRHSHNVNIYELTYDEIIRLNLTIPDYQRIYCWDEGNVKCLLDDIFDHIGRKTHARYRLGTVILHSHDGTYDIIDGQQRLVTLALLLAEAGFKTGLLKEKFTSRRSYEYVAYNKHLIHEYVQRHPNIREKVSRLLDTLEFSVLVLRDTSLDLAYTFFSNQNSRGVALTDYDLLKAHHLRYIPSALEQQSMHAAERWNKMIEDGRAEDKMTAPDYERALDTYIYRLRKWMRKRKCEDSSVPYRIKREFAAAPVIEEIPSFGERFYFNEPIQGGTHFFSYVEQHINLYKQFILTEEYHALHDTIQGGSNQWYRDIIESMLFCYFMRFGNYYLSDALVVIMRILLQHRYVTSRATKASVIHYAGESELALIIDQATSPTFFLAEARNIAKELMYPQRQAMTPVMRSMRNKASHISRQLENKITVESFKNLNR